LQYFFVRLSGIITDLITFLPITGTIGLKMALLWLPHLPKNMALVDNQGQKSDAPRALTPAEIVRRMAETKPRHNRTLAEAMRIAAQADAEIQGRELAIERMIHSNDSIAHQHDLEHERAAKIQGFVTPVVNVSGNSNYNTVNNNELQNNSTGYRSAECKSADVFSGGDCNLVAAESAKDQPGRVESIDTQAHPTGTPKSEPAPPSGDTSPSDFKTPPHRGVCSRSGESFEFLQWTGSNELDVFDFLESNIGFDLGDKLFVFDGDREQGFDTGTFFVKDSEDNISGYTEAEFNKLFVRL